MKDTIVNLVDIDLNLDCEEPPETTLNSDIKLNFKRMETFTEVNLPRNPL